MDPIHGPARRTSSPDLLHLRSSHHSRAPDGSVEAGAQLPHADPELLLEGRAGGAFHPLAAGSPGQLQRAARVPETRPDVLGRGGPDRRSDRIQPLRLLPRPGCGIHSLCLRARACGRTFSLPAEGGRLTRLRRLPEDGRRHAPRGPRFPRRPQPAGEPRGGLRHPP